jgi:predicted nuclease of restriction endonuclease-like RecB superfamily
MPSKFNSKHVVIDGIKFHSEAEGAYYCLLKKDEQDGRVRDIQRQVKFQISARVSYIADFVYLRKTPADFVKVIVDVKGFRTPEYKLKKTLLEDLRNVQIEEVKLKRSFVKIMLATYPGVAREK